MSKDQPNHLLEAWDDSSRPKVSKVRHMGAIACAYRAATYIETIVSISGARTGPAWQQRTWASLPLTTIWTAFRCLLFGICVYTGGSIFRRGGVSEVFEFGSLRRLTATTCGHSWAWRRFWRMTLHGSSVSRVHSLAGSRYSRTPCCSIRLRPGMGRGITVSQARMVIIGTCFAN